MNAPAPASEEAGLLERARTFAANASAQRVALLLLLAALSAFLVVEVNSAPTRTVSVGDVAERDIRATTSFEYVDWEETEAREAAAVASVLPVFDFDATLTVRVKGRLSDAFAVARRQYTERLMSAQAEERTALTDAELSTIAVSFVRNVELSLDPEDVNHITAARWDRSIEELAATLLSETMRAYIVADRSVLPNRGSAEVVRILSEDRRDQVRIDSFEGVLTPSEARQQVSLQALERTGATDESTLRAAVALARAMVRPNFSYNQLMTDNARRETLDGVTQVVVPVVRGTALARDGDVLTQQQVDSITALQESRAGTALAGVLLSLFAFTGLVWVTLYSFAASWVKGFSTRPRDLGAAGALVVLALLLARLVVALSDPVSHTLGAGLAPMSLWYMVPFAGCAMLVRILIGSESALVWVLGTAALLGIMMDQQVLFALYFVISGVTAAGALAQMRERAGVLRAGVLAGLVNAAAALLLTLVQANLGSLATMAGLSSQPLWDVAFAFLGGVLSGVLVLGVVPIFESFGFVTDYKLLELANLNHPLLRQLMLRAPGTYHHSVTVAQLCEAAAERIGANALQTRVACYFHDIGKAVNPKYFIENQRGGPNPHDRLPPRTSAKVIVNHVRDGEAIARQHNLPQVILDGITMHHGSGLIQYFYAKAVEQAKPGEVVDQADFRYPGQPPNSRETGIMMLADKVEAACRTLKDKSPESLRALIQKLVNGAVLDGQLDHCPLTVKELYSIVDAFTDCLMAIYHHRIEYPGIPSQPTPAVATEQTTGPIITLEMATNPLRDGGTDPRVAEPEPSSFTDPRLGLQPDPVPDPSLPQVQEEPDYESAVHQTVGSTWVSEEER